jgi:hypothetical protein
MGISLKGLGLLVLAAVAGSAQAGPLGAPFLVNGSSPNASRNLLDVTTGEGGDAGLLYLDNALQGRYIRRYDSQGTGYVPAEGTMGPSGEAIAIDRVGNQILVGLGTGSVGVYARVLNKAGVLVVPAFRVDTNLSGTQFLPTVAANGDGTFAVMWGTTFSSSSSAMQARLYNLNGTARSGMLTVATASHTMIGGAHAALDAAGNATVVWQQRNFATPIGFSAWTRKYNSVGGSLLSAVRLDDVDGQALVPHVAVRPDGSAGVVVWSDLNGSSRVIKGQRLSASGTKAGSNFVVSDTSGNTSQNDVAMMDDGSFAVVWDNHNTDVVPTSIPDVRIRQYTATGVAVAPEAIVSDGVLSNGARVGMDLAGNILVGYQRRNVAAAQWEIYARRYAMDTLPPITPIGNGVPVTGLSGAAGSWQYFKFNVPAGTPSLSLTMTGAGNADFLLRFAALPTPSAFDISPGLPTSNESVLVGSPPAGDFYIAVWGASAYSGVSVTVSY